MAQYIYTLKPVRPEMLADGLKPDEEKVIGAHFAYLSDLKDQGVVKLAGRTTNTDKSSFGLVIFAAKNEEAARQIMASDPAVGEGVLAAQLFPFRISLMGDATD